MSRQQTFTRQEVHGILNTFGYFVIEGIDDWFDEVVKLNERHGVAETLPWSVVRDALHARADEYVRDFRFGPSSLVSGEEAERDEIRRRELVRHASLKDATALSK